MSEGMSEVIKALVAIQSGLKAPKDQSAGRYRYRNIEDINEAVKPLAAAHGCAVVYTDEFTEDGLCISTCRLINEHYGEINAKGVSYVNRAPKNMSLEQSCGAASSYARKYAACGLFAIDSSERDPDRVNASEVPTRSHESASNVVRVEDTPNIQESVYDIAKKRLWSAIQMKAELEGREPKDIAKELKAKPGWSDDALTLNKIAEQIEKALNARISEGN